MHGERGLALYLRSVIIKKDESQNNFTKMQDSISFSSANLPNARKLLKNICIISKGFAEKEHLMHKIGIEPKKYEGPYTATESALRQRIQQLEEDLLKTSEERDSALEENKAKIDELRIDLLSLREAVKRIIKSKLAKEKRIRQLEEKINDM